MIVYVKNRLDFATRGFDAANSWTIPISSALDDTGSVAIKQTKDKYLDDWIYVDGHIFVISAESPQNGINTLTISDPATIFSRPLVWPESPPTTFGEFIADRVTAEFINCADAEYAIPYLSVVNTDHTEFTAQELDDTRLYSLEDIIKSAKERGVNIEYTIADNALRMSISTKKATVHNVFFDDGSSELDTETYSNEITAKVTVMKKIADSDPVSYTATDYYLGTDGSLSSAIPQNRAKGKWEYATAEADEDALETAEGVVADNISSHKIEFYSKYEYSLWDAVRIKLANQVYDSYVVAVTKSDGDTRYKYRCGELATNITEKMKAAGTASRSTVISGGGGDFLSAHPVGSYYWSAVATSPQELYGGVWQQIKDKFILAAGDSYASGAVGGEAVHTLTASEMPAHEGHLGGNNSSGLGNYAACLLQSDLTTYGSSGRGWSLQNGNEAIPAGMTRGGGGAHNNMPPYEVAYCWKRTA